MRQILIVVNQNDFDTNSLAAIDVCFELVLAGSLRCLITGKRLLWKDVAACLPAFATELFTNDTGRLRVKLFLKQDF